MNGRANPQVQQPTLSELRAANTPCVWILNLDAEHELEIGHGYSPTRSMREIVRRQGTQLWNELLAPGDYLLRESDGVGDRVEPLELLRLPHDPEQIAELAANAAAQAQHRVNLEVARNLPGFAWSPTPRALEQLRSVGALPASAPEVEILRKVNARPFAAELRETFRGESFEKHIVRGLEQALDQLGEPADNGWLVRRTFGAAGRGRRRVATGKPAPEELDWLVASLRRGPLVIEPWVLITREFTRSGSVNESGEVEIARPCFQRTNDSGAWLETQHAQSGEVSRGEDERLQAAFERAGLALAAAGYSGPFGIDAYLHRVPGQRLEVLNPLSEINARFTMDWSYSTEP